jgi:hypothetical protein
LFADSGYGFDNFSVHLAIVFAGNQPRAWVTGIERIANPQTNACIHNGADGFGWTFAHMIQRFRYS